MPPRTRLRARQQNERGSQEPTDNRQHTPPSHPGDTNLLANSSESSSMADRDRSRSRSRSRSRKIVLSGSKDWIRWADLMESKLDEQVNGWAIVQGTRQKPDDDADQKEKDRFRSDSAATIRIIKSSISEDMHTLVVGEKDPKRLWELLKDACNKKGQGVVYAVLQEMLNYPKITKAKGYDKPVIQSCAEVKTLARKLRDSIAKDKDVIDSVAIIIWLDSLHTDFDNVIASLLDGDKTMEEMQQILSSHEQKNLSKRATGTPAEVAMNAKGSKLPYRNEDRKCYNCNKVGHLAKNCREPNKKEEKKRKEAEDKTDKDEQKRSKPNPKGNSKGGRAHQTKSKSKKDAEDDSEDDDYPETAVHMARSQTLEADEKKIKRGEGWWLDSAASRHISNDKNKFTKLRFDQYDKSFLFMTAKKGESIASAGVGDCYLTLRNGEKMHLKDVSYVPTLDSDLISLGQLQKDGWEFESVDQGILLLQNRKPVVVAMKVGTMYWVPTTSTPTTAHARMVSGRGRATHQEPDDPLMKLWHRRMGHPSNKRLIMASKLLDGLDLGKPKVQEELWTEDELEEVLPIADDGDSDLSAIDDYVLDESTKTATRSKTHSESLKVGIICEPCILSKSTRVVQHKPMRKTYRKLERVHIDLWGPHDPPSVGGNVYAAILIDDFTRKGWLRFLKRKDEFFEHFKPWVTEVEKEAETSLKYVRIDGGGEFISILFKDWCSNRGIGIEYSSPYMHEENSVAESNWRVTGTIKDSLLIDSGLPKEFWANAMDTAMYLRNRLPTKARSQIPEEAYTGERQSVKHLRVWGSLAYIHIPKEKRRKGDTNKAWKGIFLGYPKSTKQAIIWQPQTQKVSIQSTVEIDEEVKGATLLKEYPLPVSLSGKPTREPAGEPRPRGRPRKEVVKPNDNDSDDHSEHSNGHEVRQRRDKVHAPNRRSATRHEASGETDTEDLALVKPKQMAEGFPKTPGTNKDPILVVEPERRERPPKRKTAEGAAEAWRQLSRSLAMIHVHERMMKVVSDRVHNVSIGGTDPDKRPRLNVYITEHNYNTKVEEPKTYKEAIEHPVYGRQWRDAVHEELAMLLTRGTWEYTKLPKGRKAIGYKWVFRVKYKEGKVDRFKARLTAQGFSQKYGIDYTETFAPAVRRESLRIFLCLIAGYDLELHQMDVKGAYLEGELPEEEEIYMKIPDTIDIPINRGPLVCRLKRSLYGLKQSGRVWNKKFVTFLKKIGFTQLNADPSILVKRKQGETSKIIMSVYVDDLLIAAKTMSLVNSLKQELTDEYTMTDLGEARNIIRWRITRNRAARSLMIDQAAFTRDLLESHGLTECNHSTIPMKPGIMIPLENEEDSEETDLHEYQKLSGSLTWLATGTRPDIAFATGRISQYNADPRKGHANAAKRILRYLKGTVNYGIMYTPLPAKTTTGLGASLDLPGTNAGFEPYPTGKAAAPHDGGLIGYADASYAGDLLDRKSIMGYCFLLNRGVITWSSRRQRTVSTSTTEAEYIAAGHAAREAVWIRRYINEIGLDLPMRKINLKADSTGGIALSKNPEGQSKTKHIDVQHHFVRELIEEGELCLDWVPTKEMLADGLTKALPFPQFRAHRHLMGIVDGGTLKHE